MAISYDVRFDLNMFSFILTISFDNSYSIMMMFAVLDFQDAADLLKYVYTA